METSEPFNIFSHRIDVRGVVQACRSMASEVRLVDPEDDWRELTLLGPKKVLRKRSRLRVSHDSAFYDGPGWSRYVFGMSNYVSAFSPVPRRTEIMRVIESFQFILAFPDVDLAVGGNDAERLTWLYGICRCLDGIIFTPSMLLDASGRLLTSIDGRFDPQAVLPAIPPGEDRPVSVDFDDRKLEHDGTPPTAERVARRAIVLAAVGNRGLIENELYSLESPGEDCRNMLDWIRNSDAADEPEPEEWKVLQRPTGRLESQSMVDAVWRLEGLGVLLWALGLYELPPYDQLVTPADIFEAIQIFDASAARDIVSHAKLRPREELESYRNHATIAHWRFREFSLRPVPIDFAAASKGCWIGTFDITRFRIADNDVLVGDVNISLADAESVKHCLSTAQERHRAIDWLLGESNIYSETDTST